MDCRVKPGKDEEGGGEVNKAAIKIFSFDHG
jgi:hypothetical protein